MTFEHDFNDWQHLPSPAAHKTCSPNLLLVLPELQRRWSGFTSLGCYGARPIRGSASIPSSHTYGAAIDVGYPATLDDTVAAEVVGFLVGRSGELHVQAVHDYRRCRIWRAGRTDDEGDACSLWWKAQRASSTTGMGQTWANHLHLEVTAAGWDDTTPVADRWSE